MFCTVCVYFVHEPAVTYTVANYKEIKQKIKHIANFKTAKIFIFTLLLFSLSIYVIMLASYVISSDSHLLY